MICAGWVLADEVAGAVDLLLAACAYEKDEDWDVAFGAEEGDAIFLAD